jgi:2-(1,2-epoxy-1,2-dihydrophenyl)acetyl-CoA isomerase
VPSLALELIETINSMNLNPGVRAIVLTGAGTHFCAGADAKEAKKLATDIADGIHPAEPFGGILRLVHQATLAIYESPKPVVAAINGPAAAGGLDLALACDCRLAATSAKFVESYIKLGLPPLNGGAFLLAKIVGHSQAVRILLSGESIPAEEALAIGLVDALHGADVLLEKAIGLADRLAVGGLDVISFTKQEIRRGSSGTLSDALARAYFGGVTFVQSPEYQAATKVMLGGKGEKRLTRAGGDA